MLSVIPTASQAKLSLLGWPVAAGLLLVAGPDLLAPWLVVDLVIFGPALVLSFCFVMGTLFIAVRQSYNIGPIAPGK